MKTTAHSVSPVLPRLIRFRDAPGYLGMDRNRFNAEVRPGLTEVPIGKQGIAFDRIELDAWVEQYVASNGRPARQKGGNRAWDANAQLGCVTAPESGTLKSRSSDERFSKALAQATSKKRS